MSATVAASVYVHAPFCARRCSYCDFAVTVDRDPGHELWLTGVARELELVRREERFALASTLDTLYVGGGTPSLLGGGAMRGLAEAIGRKRLTSGGLEWTAEANPESLTHELAADWRAAGVNRVSLGAQSFHDPSLRWMGRLHGAEGPRRAVEAARRAGIDDISVDLIFGLPERLGRDWAADLARALALDVPHLSLYGLTVESRTPLGWAVAQGQESVASDERYRDEYLEAAERLSQEGYEHYEVSSFARPGAYSRHNQVYWSERPYLGLGNGAHSFATTLRRWNLRDWAEYSTAVAEGRLPTEGEEELDGPARLLESVWLGLRTRAGVPTGSLDPSGRGAVGGWVRRGLAVVEEGRVRLTAEGWLVLDALALELEEGMVGRDHLASGTHV